jgi:hypothetical protein
MISKLSQAFKVQSDLLVMHGEYDDLLEFPIVANPPFVQPVDGWKKRHRLEQGPVRVFYEKLTGIVKGVGAILEKHDPSFVLAREHR